MQDITPGAWKTLLKFVVIGLLILIFVVAIIVAALIILAWYAATK